MGSGTAEVLMMSKRFLLVFVFFGSAFIAAAADDPTATVTDSVTMGSAADQDSPSDSTPGSETPAAAASAEAAAATSSTRQLEDTANAEAPTTINPESSADSAETTEASHERTTTISTTPPRHDNGGFNGAAGVTDATQIIDAGTSVAGASSAMAIGEVGGSQSTESGLVTSKEVPSTDPEKEGVTTESETASSRMSSQGDGDQEKYGDGEGGTEKASDSGVQAATSQAKDSEETTRVPHNVDGDKPTTEPGNEVTPRGGGQSGNEDIAPRQSALDAHRGLFITIGIMIAVIIVIGTLCLICMKCRGKSPSDKQRITVEEGVAGPLDASSPIPDAEMVKDEAPMQELENPAVTPNGGGQHISKDEEDNGWVVPLDELSKTEKDKPETENTKL